MNLAEIYVNLIRIAVIIIAIYKAYKKDYMLILPAIIVIVLSFLFLLLDIIWGIKIDKVGSAIYYTILVMSIYLGGGFDFYNKYASWDRAIHFLSGVAFVSLGIALSNKEANLSKFSILFFSLTLASFFHVIWETAEYIYDCIAHTDHQRWQKHHKKTVNHKPKSAIQSAGLVDTMNDTIVCMIGAILACIIWWFVLN